MADTTNLLTSEELDALAAGLKDGSIEANTGLNGGLRAVKHDLASEDSSLGPDEKVYISEASFNDLGISFRTLTLPDNIEYIKFNYDLILNNEDFKRFK